MYDNDLNNYVDNILLGSCYNGYGTVHLAVHKSSDDPVVIKKYNVDDKDHEEYDLIENEIRRTRQLQHPNVLPYLHSFVSGRSIYAVAPLMHYGSCSRLIGEYFNHGLPELAIAFIVRDVLCGLDYIHKRGIIHRAIRASHILISALGEVCITGLRYACDVVENGKWQKNIYSFPKSTVHNLKWLSPEVLEQDLRGYNERSDIYSVGMAVCELANGVEPFFNMPVTLMLTEKVRGSMPFLVDRTNFPLDSVEIENARDDEESHRRFEALSNRLFSDTFHDFTELCLQRNPDNRPNLTQLRKHEFFKQCRKSDENLTDLLKSVPLIQDRFAHSHDDLEYDDLKSSIERMGQINSSHCIWDFED